METCDLCIIGAGYAAVNAFNAASKHLPKGSRVVVVAQQTAGVVNGWSSTTLFA